MTIEQHLAYGLILVIPLAALVAAQNVARDPENSDPNLPVKLRLVALAIFVLFLASTIDPG